MSVMNSNQFYLLSDSIKFTTIINKQFFRVTPQFFLRFFFIVRMKNGK